VGDAGGVPVGDAVVEGRVSATVGELGGFDVGLGVGLDDGAGAGRPVDEIVGRGVVGRGVDVGVSSADVRAITSVPSSPTVPLSTTYVSENTQARMATARRMSFAQTWPVRTTGDEGRVTTHDEGVRDGLTQISSPTQNFVHSGIGW
jgi:hypothetical protein